MRKRACLRHGRHRVLRMGSSSNNKNDGDEIAVTDNGNYIVDLHFKAPIPDARAAAGELKAMTAVVEHGAPLSPTRAQRCRTDAAVAHQGPALPH